MHPKYFGPEAETFYQGETAALFAMTPERYGIGQRVGLAHDPRTEITDDSVRHTLHNARWYPIERNGRSYELMIFNHERAEDGVDAFFPTYSSSIQDNPGNAYEAAATATRYPNRTLVYVATPGNGSTSALSGSEILRYGATGAMAERGMPVGFAQDLAVALAERGLDVRNVIGHSAGTAMAMAFARALPEGQLESMVLYAAPHATAVNPIPLAYNALIKENGRRGRESRQHIIDSTAIDDRRKKFVLEEHPEIYRQKRTLRQWMGKIAMLATNVIALSHGPKVMIDGLGAVFARQPHAAVTIIVPEQDGLHTHDLIFNMRGVVDAVADKNAQAKLRAVFIRSGQHAFNTYNPAFIDELTHAALEHWDYQQTANAV